MRVMLIAHSPPLSPRRPALLPPWRRAALTLAPPPPPPPRPPPPPPRPPSSAPAPRRPSPSWGAAERIGLTQRRAGAERPRLSLLFRVRSAVALCEADRLHLRHRLYAAGRVVILHPRSGPDPFPHVFSPS